MAALIDILGARSNRRNFVAILAKLSCDRPVIGMTNFAGGERILFPFMVANQPIYKERKNWPSFEEDFNIKITNLEDLTSAREDDQSDGHSVSTFSVRIKFYTVFKSQIPCQLDF